MKIFDWLDGIEVAVAAIVAALLLVFGPLFITYRFVLAHRQAPALHWRPLALLRRGLRS